MPNLADAVAFIVNMDGLGDEIFTFIDHRTNEALHFNSTKIRAECEADETVQISRIPIRHEHIAHIVQNNGIETRKLARLAESMEQAVKPILLADMGHDDEYVVIDGNHRMVLLWQAHIRFAGAYIVPRRVWEKHLIELPRELADVLVDNTGNQ